VSAKQLATTAMKDNYLHEGRFGPFGTNVDRKDLNHEVR